MKSARSLLSGHLPVCSVLQCPYPLGGCHDLQDPACRIAAFRRSQGGADPPPAPPSHPITPPPPWWPIWVPLPPSPPNRAQAGPLLIDDHRGHPGWRSATSVLQVREVWA